MFFVATERKRTFPAFTTSRKERPWEVTQDRLGILGDIINVSDERLNACGVNKGSDITPETLTPPPAFGFFICMIWKAKPVSANSLEADEQTQIVPNANMVWSGPGIQFKTLGVNTWVCCTRNPPSTLGWAWSSAVPWNTTVLTQFGLLFCQVSRLFSFIFPCICCRHYFGRYDCTEHVPNLFFFLYIDQFNSFFLCLLLTVAAVRRISVQTALKHQKEVLLSKSGVLFMPSPLDCGYRRRVLLTVNAWINQPESVFHVPKDPTGSEGVNTNNLLHVIISFNHIIVRRRWQ